MTSIADTVISIYTIDIGTGNIDPIRSKTSWYQMSFFLFYPLFTWSYFYTNEMTSRRLTSQVHVLKGQVSRASFKNNNVTDPIYSKTNRYQTSFFLFLFFHLVIFLWWPVKDSLFKGDFYPLTAEIITIKGGLALSWNMSWNIHVPGSLF